jgi:excinuclease ABC subunit A
LQGIRQNNLKDLDVEIPLGRLTVVTGLSGAGKSSLVFETLHAEGQRRYVETFSPYTRQFLDTMDKPRVDSVQHIRPSIALQQKGTARTSRSTVGTMTELTDMFKVWFCHVAKLYDPASGELIEAMNSQRLWELFGNTGSATSALVCFEVKKPARTPWKTVLEGVLSQGFSRLLTGIEAPRLQRLSTEALAEVVEQLQSQGASSVTVVVDRVRLEAASHRRFIEAADTAFHYGKGQLCIHGAEGGHPLLGAYSKGLRSSVTAEAFNPPTPAMFSFNSPVGACPTCRGFGRVIEIDERLVIPDDRLSLNAGAIRPFQGEVYRHSLSDLQRHAPAAGVDLDTPWRELSEPARAWVWNGEADMPEDQEPGQHHWYGIRRFFNWLEGNTYKMHIRVFLSKYRAYTTCPDCRGDRLKPDALNWKWMGHTLPALYRMPVAQLLALLEPHAPPKPRPEDVAGLTLHQMVARLQTLDAVGLGYLDLDRTSRTLSGGEAQRINLTTCLGTSLTDTLFVLDEPSVGLHARDINRLAGVLHRLRDAGNTVVVVEHDEALMRAADHLIEIGPEPGAGGGHLVFEGPPSTQPEATAASQQSLTLAYLHGQRNLEQHAVKRPVEAQGPALHIRGACCHNLQDLSVSVPLGRLVVLTGVSGSGKSTLLDNVLYQCLMQQRRKVVEAPAKLQSLTGERALGEVVRVDQSRLSRTPRSNTALYAEVWDAVRNLLARTDAARSAGMSASTFSFNTGFGRCDHCQGLGYERIEMQFLADVTVPCPVCEGKRFKPETLAVTWNGYSVADILAMDVQTACSVFKEQPMILSRLRLLESVGLGYLTLGQPLSTLSGGESQRLKLVKYMGKLEAGTQGALLLMDEPTTGLHRHDVARLLDVMQRIVEAGHSLVVIEHQLDVIAAADWVVELGPEAGEGGGQLVFEGTPEQLKGANTHTAASLKAEHAAQAAPLCPPQAAALPPVPASIQITGAREHNLRSLSLEIPHRAMTVVTGVSGSGKSSLAFDILFAEGQRRFMESMSAYARQFVEQMPRAEVDAINHIPPTVAIEQRVTRGSAKSTVATVTEVAQYLRLLYARLGIQYGPESGLPVQTQSLTALRKQLQNLVDTAAEKALQAAQAGRRKPAAVWLCAPLIRGRKGHHQPMADWALGQQIPFLRCDGVVIETAAFTKLDRYREHDIEAAFVLGADVPLEALLERALELGKGACFALQGRSQTWLSTHNADPKTGEVFPTLDPKHFSWNSPRGWCPHCRGYGQLLPWMPSHDHYEHLKGLNLKAPVVCPECGGTRLNRISRAVRLHFKPVPGGQAAHALSLTLPELLSQPADQLLDTLERLDLDRRGRAIATDIITEVRERLKFLDQVGLSYLPMDRSSDTLSGGEAQRIRLASQLGTNLTGVCYILDEPSIGLHARDNAALIASLHTLKDKGNTLVVVEHDEDMMRAADHLIDLGPGAGIHGGHLLAQGAPEAVMRDTASLTGKLLKHGLKHPARGQWRTLPEAYNPRRKASKAAWVVLREPRLRNLKGGELHLPTGRLTMVCGLSGAGKSTLIRDLLKPALQEATQRKSAKLSGRACQLPIKDIAGGHCFRSVIEVDQEPIGKTPRSTPATYIGAFDLIREVFASLPEARMHGYGPSTFSFNTKGGRCEVCKGAGRIKLEMPFMADAYQRCEACNGSRYGPELSDLRWNGHNIAEVLAMSFEEAEQFFSFHARLKDLMTLMVSTGLGYLRLGQSSPTLSGGEAQRLKLVGELSHGLPTWRERSSGQLKANCYLLEEPTIGLHLADCQRLIELLHQLVDQGHTVVVIEHHLDLLAEADWLVEVGPGSAAQGGQIIYQGPAKGILEAKNSPTGPWLRPLLG